MAPWLSVNSPPSSPGHSRLLAPAETAYFGSCFPRYASPFTRRQVSCSTPRSARSRTSDRSDVPVQIKALDGLWSHGAGEYARIEDGRVCIRGNIKDITLADGIVRIPKWRAVKISQHRIDWESDDNDGSQTRVWHRLQEDQPAESSSRPVSPSRGGQYTPVPSVLLTPLGTPGTPCPPSGTITPRRAIPTPISPRWRILTPVSPRTPGTPSPLAAAATTIHRKVVQGSSLVTEPVSPVRSRLPIPEETIASVTSTRSIQGHEIAPPRIKAIDGLWTHGTGEFVTPWIAVPRIPLLKTVT